MEKPPFQFGLRSIFLATTGVAVLMAAGELGRILAWMMVLWSMAAVILFAVLAAFAVVKRVSIDTVRLARWTLNRFSLRLGCWPPNA